MLVIARTKTRSTLAALRDLKRRLVRQECSGLYARDLKGPAATLILARCLVVKKHHVACGLCELGPIALIGLPRQSVNLAPYQPAKIVAIGRLTKRTVQCSWLNNL